MLVCGTYGLFTTDMRMQVKGLTLSIQSIAQTTKSCLPAQRITEFMCDADACLVQRPLGVLVHEICA